jgi:pimeloyl-ACP methyl ester carboxylesterase
MYRRLQLSSTVIALLSATPAIAAQLPADTSSHRSAFVSVEGVRVHYLGWGGDGSAMLFVPGAGHTAHVFDDFAPRFVDDYRVVAITRVGFGESDMPSGTGYSLAERVAHMRAVLDSLDLTNVVLVGHSLGGDEIRGFAAEYPERVIAGVYLDAAYDHVQALLWQSAVGASLGAGPPVPTGEDLRTVAGYQRYLARLGGVTLPLGEVLASYRFDSAGAYEGRRSAPHVRQELQAATEPPDFAGVRAPALAIYSDFEAGFVFGLQPPPRLRRLTLPRFGVGYRVAGDLSGWHLVVGSPF